MKKNNSTPPTSDMVARTSDSKSPFMVHKNEPDTPSQADALNEELNAEEAELQAVEDGIAQRKADLATKKEKANELARQEKMAEWRTKLDDAADYAEIARTTADPERAKDYLRRSKMAEREAAYLAKELNLEVPAEFTTEAPSKLLPLSTNKALLWIGVLFAISLLLTWGLGAPLAADPNNATGQSILHNAPIRALLSFTLTFLTFLVSAFFIRVAFPSFYRIWHNRIDSERSLDSLLAEAPAWAVLLSLLGLFYMFMQLFASFYQAMFS